MAGQGIVNATFQVVSGALCFGSLSEILKGSHATIQVAPTPRPQGSGTILRQPLQYNVAARNGSWNKFALLNVESSNVEGWFAAHSDVDPLRELVNILRVSGSPYEYDAGDKWNNDRTRAERVLVINRYDWGMSHDDDITRAEVQEDGGVFANTNSIGLVDYTHGSNYVQRWIQQAPGRRGASAHGVWMYIPEGEYMFGRFGFDDDYKEARSFLFFAQRTDFYTTKFPGQPGPLRKWERVLDRLQHGLRAGEDHSGVKRLRGMYAPAGVDEYIFDAADAEILLAYRPELTNELLELITGRQFSPLAPLARKPALIVDPWRPEVVTLLHEITLSFLEHCVLPHRAHSAASTAHAGPAIFPEHNKTSPHHNEKGLTFDGILLSVFAGTWPQQITGLKLEPIGGRIRAFLNRRSGNIPVEFDDECLMGLARVAAHIFTSALDAADIMTLDNESLMMETRGAEDVYILPYYVRLALYYDEVLLDNVQYSAFYWLGAEPS
ncbi:hypothetical protein PLIIFM63780_001861 [Purpureocillium lilacinum]|nr:hypothetical protein PLIIFM63780_001861 [Purpureocillium lilacinum]